MSIRFSGSASSSVKYGEISAVKILADGTRVDLGVLSRGHRNPLVRLWWRITDAFRRRT